MSKRTIPKSAARSIAGERIAMLFEIGQEEFRRGNTQRAKRYIELALRIGMRYNVSLSAWKRRFCPECKNFYRFPENASIRLRRGHIIVRCNSCGNISRYPYK
ncbi:MAG: hypothetical protein OEV21_04975 [Thermoplasmata archaeon]|nr:hypothetical protein [Thermoplasmata archaeon]